MWKGGDTGGELLTSIVKVGQGVSNITFSTGQNIHMIMIAKQNGVNTNYYAPSYAFSGQSVSMPTTSNETLVITVVPEKGYRLESWTKTGSGSQSWTANGLKGNYKDIREITKEECTSSPVGLNATDTRNNVSYTVGNINGLCAMLSNLRLEAGTTLTTDDSDLKDSTFTLPSGGWQNDDHKKYMKECRARYGYQNSVWSASDCPNQSLGVTEYYYNWYAATANDGNQNNQALGSICPKNWKLYDNNNLGIPMNLFNNNKVANQPALVSSGYYISNQLYYHGNRGRWWGSTYGSNPNAITFALEEGNVRTTNMDNGPQGGRSVRCIHN